MLLCFIFMSLLSYGLRYYNHQGHSFIEERKICQGRAVYSKKELYQNKHKHTTKCKTFEICPHNNRKLTRSPKSYSTMKSLFSASELQVTSAILSVLSPFFRRLSCVALFFGIASNLDCSVAQSSASSWLVKQSIQTPRERCRLPHQTSGLWQRTSKGPPHPQLTHSFLLVAAVKTNNKDNQYCAMYCVKCT